MGEGSRSQARPGTQPRALRHGRAAALLGSLAMVLAVFGLGLTASAGAEELSHAEKEKLPVIVQWAFRNGAATNPLGCGEGCAALWTAEHSAMPNGPAAQEIWDQLGAFEASEGLWPSLSTLATDLSYAGIGFEVGPFTLGWHVGGPSGKWMKFQEQGAATTPQYGWCGTAGSYFEELAAPGEAYGTSPESGLPAQPKASGWTYIGRQHYCYYGGIGYYAEVAVPTCNESISPPTPWPGWSNPSEAYATCGGIKYLTALRTRPFHYAAPEEYTSQTAYDVVTNSAPEPAPSVEAVEAALKAALEASGSGPFNAWVRYVTTGEGSNPTTVPLPSEEFGAGNPGEPGRTIACAGKPVNCATGNEIDTQTDISVPGRGVPLELSRTYNSQAAVAEGSPGPFGYGWSSSFSDHLTINTETSTVTVDQANGSTVAFTGSLGTPGPLTAPAWAQSTLVHNSDGTYLYTLPDQEAFHFDSSGRLTSVADRSGNTTTLSYSSGHLEAITDPAGRTITLAYNEEGRVESATDPMGHITKYGYESGKLVSVTQPGGTSPRWQFKYDSSHQLTEVIDGRGGATVNEYGSSHRVSAQTDPAGRKLSFEYQEETVPYQTTITNHATGAVTTESFDGAHELISITHGYGTTEATTETSTYDHEGELASHTDGNGHTTTYTYDTAGNRTSNTDPLGDKTSWTYDATHDVETTTKPSGEVTTITRNTHGEPETISRPAPGSKTQTTKYAYNSYGELTTVEDPLKRVWGYEYDANGDRTAETDPEGDKRTWSYNEDSQETATVSPRGNVLGGEPATFTTTIARDAQGRPTAINEPGGGGSGSPANKSAASITGGAQEGQTLTANTGIWTGAAPLTYTYQWRHCNGSGESCTSITGATGATYALSHGDVGDTIRVVVTATNALGFASSTSAATATVSVPVPAYVSKFGTHGSGAGELGGAKGIALDGKGDFVVSDEGNARVDVFKENGEFVKMFGSYGSGAGQFGEIKGIAVDSKGDIWVADQGNSRISEFNEKGEYLKAIGSAGTGAGQFKEVKGVAIDVHNNVWVADTGNNRVEKFNEKGEFVATYGWGVSNGEEKAETCTSSCRAGNTGTGHGQFAKPRTLAADSAGNIWITDTGNTRVEELNEKGEYLRVFGSTGSSNGQFYEPIGITVDSHSNVWVTDAGNSRVQEFNEKGEYDTQFGAAGSSNGQLNEPWSVRVNSHGEIFVSDSANYRIQTFAPTGSPESTTTPTISGELLSGQTLRASSGNWKGAATITYTYQWEDCNTSGESCAAIPGATGSAHLLAAGDIGHTLRVVISATNPAGTLTSTSGATEVVAAARTTKYAYDANGNLETQTDPEGNKTTYTYDADNEPTKTETPNKAAIETGYDGAGQVTSQTDGNKHTTTYARNVLEEVAEVTDPLGHKTTKHYDFAGNLTSLTDPAKRTTSYAYDEDSRLLTIRYSAETTPTVKYEYDKDGNRTTQHDGTGTSTYTYDQLDRLTETKDGHGDTTSYEYDLANEQTKITYPNGKAVTRSYDSNGRLKSVTDWLEHTTKFGYDAGSNLIATIFPSATGDEDTYKYDEADQASEIKMTKGTEALASLAYTRNRDGEITEAASKGLPGEEKPAYVYDENSRITKAAGSTYKYDAANNATQIAGSTYAYNSADELETGPSLTYTYDEIGQRTKTTPSGGAATSYGYDQAGNLTSVERPKEGEAAAIKDTYAYNGDGLRTSQAISGTVGYLAWDTAESLPLVLNDGTNSYIYGPANVPVEQINNSTSTVEYLHHDQAGSTRLLTGSTGTVTGKCTYGAYGTPTCEGTATTPLGYDSQYTNSDTGLVYLRARQYDPATAQFTSVDPLAPITREPYAYAENDPLNVGDPTGLFSIGEIPLIGGGLEKVATRYVGFWDGFTQPLFGGTAALRSTLGLNGGLNQCSSEYQIANQIGGYTLDAEAVAPVAFGGVMVAGLAVRGLGASEGEVLTSNLFSQIASSLPDAVLARLRAAMFTLAGTAGVGYSEVQGLQAVAPAKSGSSTCGCS